MMGIGAAWTKDLRVCVPDYFGRYFLFRSPEDDISESKFREIIAAARDKAQLQKHFDDLAEVHMLGVLLERMRFRVEEIDKGAIAIVISAVFDSEKTLLFNAISEGSSLAFPLYLVRRLIVLIENKSMRCDFLAQSLELSTKLFLASRVAFADPGDQAESLLYPKDWERLRSIWIEKSETLRRLDL